MTRSPAIWRAASCNRSSISTSNGDVLWELWIDGFDKAMALRPEGWAEWADGDNPNIADALSRLSLLIAIARQESELDSVQINAFQDQAPAGIRDIVQRLHSARSRGGDLSVMPASAPMAKPGRNDPCHCGSGKKYKRCCGGA